MPLRLLQRLANVRPGEGRALIWSFAYFFCLLTSYYILRPVRDEMGIQGGVENLQWLFTATFVVMLVAVPAFGALVARLPRQRFVPLIYRFFAITIGVFYALLVLDIGTAHLARAYFVWISVFNLFVVSVFWSFMADMWRNEQGRRLFGFIAAGGSAGALLGPTISVLLAVPLGPVNLMLVAILFLELAVYCVMRLSREPAAGPVAASSPPPVGGDALVGLISITRSPYLAGISIWVLLLTLAGTFIYLIQANVIAGSIDDPGIRTRLFALVDLGVGIGTVAIQLLATGRIMVRCGVGLAAAALPAMAGIGFLAIFLSPVLLTVLLFQALQRITNFAVSNPAREVLFTVLAREQIYKSKNVIDTVVFHGGDAVSAWIFTGLKGIGLDASAIALLMVPVAIVWGGLGWGLGKAQEAWADPGAARADTE